MQLADENKSEDCRKLPNFMQFFYSFEIIKTIRYQALWFFITSDVII